MEKIMLIADKINLGIFIVGLIGVILSMIGIAWAFRRRANKREAARNLKLDKLIFDFKELKNSMSEHKHDDVNKRLTVMESNCSLREATVNNLIDKLNSKVDDHLSLIHDLKQAIQPLHSIETNIKLISQRMDGINELLEVKLENIQQNHGALNERVKKLEDIKH